MMMKPLIEIVTFPRIENPNNRDWIDAVNRLSGFDPTALYERFIDEGKIDVYARHQKFTYEETRLSKKRCACGCGKKLHGRRTANATEQCSLFRVLVYSIMNGRLSTIGGILSTIRGGKKCEECGSGRRIEIDHVVGVKQGGGACWLQNYRMLCHDCHVDKTNRDFKRGKYAEPNSKAAKKTQAQLRREEMNRDQLTIF